VNCDILLKRSKGIHLVYAYNSKLDANQIKPDP